MSDRTEHDWKLRDVQDDDPPAQWECSKCGTRAWSTGIPPEWIPDLKGYRCRWDRGGVRDSFINTGIPEDCAFEQFRRLEEVQNG